MDEYYRAVRALPTWLAAPLAQLPAQTVVHIQELRLRTDCAVTFTVQGRQCSASALPGCPPALVAMRLDALQIEEIFHTLCNGSVHTHERELSEGYLTTAAGNRVGVAGQFVQREGQCITLQKVTSLNLRIARSCYIHLPLELDKLLEQHFTGLLVVGEPGSGKTTLLRTIARTLAERQRLVAVVDERGELFPPEGPLPPLERIGGVDKARAVQMALRTLAPQVILLDELGSLEETMALEQGFFSGVDFIASMRRTLHRRSAVRRYRHCCNAGCCGSWSSLPGGRRRAASRKCAPYERPSARVRHVFAPVVRLAGRGCGTGQNNSASCRFTAHYRAITAHPAGDPVPPGRPAKSLPAALPRGPVGANSRRYIAAAACAGTTLCGRAHLFYRVLLRYRPRRGCTGMRTA